jgi:flagellar hook-associated protein 1 FlgK
MSLLSAFSNARASLSTVASQTAIVSRNIANADNPYASRKYANLATGQLGGVRIVSIAQSGDPALFRSLLVSTSALGAADAKATGLDRIRDVIGDVDAPTSPAARLAQLKAALSQYAVSPENGQTAEAAVAAARDMASGLNDASAAVQATRKDADDKLDQAAKNMTALLAEFQTVNGRVMSGASTGADVTDFLDRRDQIIRELSQYVGVNVQKRNGNEVALYTDSGITLFDKTARAIEFSPQAAYDPTVVGGAFKIDGVVISGAASPMPVKSGSLAGLLTLRDETAVSFQGQLDGIAYALIDGFAETNQVDPLDTARYAGLFTSTGMTTVPTSVAGAKGLSGTIRIAASVDSTQPGGNPMLLRDGAISHPGDPAFSYNANGSSGFTQRLNDLIAQFSQPRDFDVNFGAGERATLSEYSSASIGWLEGQRAEAAAEADYRAVLLSRTQESLSDRSGVNIDDEMTRMLDLERSYQASSKLLSTVGEMIDALLAIR